MMGAMIEGKLKNSLNVYNITNAPDPQTGSPSDYNQNYYTIHVDPNYHPTIPVSGSCGGTNYEVSSTREELEHELGHATGILDEIANMNQNVNPFRSEVGLPPITEYGFIGGFSEYAPIALPFGVPIVLRNHQ